MRAVTDPLTEIAGELLARTRAVTVETLYTVGCEICGYGAIDGIYYDRFEDAAAARADHMKEHGKTDT